jgi:hypothetical protein
VYWDTSSMPTWSLPPLFWLVTPWFEASLELVSRCALLQLHEQTLIRHVFVAFPLFTRQMFTNLGVNWAGTLIACLALLFAPSPFIFYVYGRRIRRSTAFGRIGDEIGQMLKAGMTPVQIQKAMAASAAAKKAEAEAPAEMVEESLTLTQIMSAADDSVGTQVVATKEQV